MKLFLKLSFSVILVAMLAVTTWAARHKALWNAVEDVSDPWSVATLFDAYAGLFTLFLWVAYKETRRVRKAVWFVLIMALGNIAVSIYVLRELWRSGDRPLAEILVRRNP